jgi:hypothetical protein
VATANPRTIVVLNTQRGGPMPWLDKWRRHLRRISRTVLRRHHAKVLFGDA